MLAGGAGTRLGGAKPTAELLGRPLLSYPLAALSAALTDVAVVAKRDTRLPELSVVPVWLEPDEPRHPLAGVAHALRRAAGRDVLICAVDLPLVREDDIRLLAAAGAGGAPAVVACGPDGAPEPLLGRYVPSSLDALERAAAGGLPARAAVLQMGARTVAPASDRALFNVNGPGDLERAAALLLRRVD